MFNRRKRHEPTLEEQYPAEFNPNVIEDVSYNQRGLLSPRQRSWIWKQELLLSATEIQNVKYNSRIPTSFRQEIDRIIKQRRNAFLEHLPKANVVRIEGNATYNPYSVIVENIPYPVAAAYWRWLRANCERVAVYTIKDWYPPLTLTVEPLGVALPTGRVLPASPTSDEKLKRAVGVGDDGEIVYEDE
jgi:hypothetical protein